MMQLSSIKTKPKVLAAVSLPLILLVMLGAVALWNLNRIGDTTKKVTHTYGSLALTDAIIESAYGMESSMRGFLLAGQDSFLVRYNEGSKSTFSLIDELKAAEEDNPAQIRRLEKVEKLLHIWHDDVAEPMIALRREIGNADNMNDLVGRFENAESDVYFARLHDQIAAYQTREEAKLATAEGEFATLMKATPLDGRAVQQQMIKIRTSQKAIHLTKDIMAAALDMEAGMQGYLLTNKDSFLTPFEDGATSFFSTVEALKSSDTADPAQAQILEAVENNILTWQVEVAQPLIDLRNGIGNAKNMDDMADLVSQAKGKVYFDQFQALIHEFADIERALKDQRKAANIDTQSNTQIIIIGGVLIALVLGGTVGVVISNGIVRPLSDMQIAIGRLAAGEQDVELEDGRGDEIGDIARSLDAIRQEAANNLRIKAALDVTSTNVMMADADRNVIYMNKSVEAMLRAAQSDIRKDLTNFNVDETMGGSIDRFHKNPAHQMGLLDRLTQQYKAHINVGGREFDLIANPIFNDKQERLGSVVEWADLTQQYAAQREIETIVDGARNGDLSMRINENGKDGFFLDLAQQINGMLDVTEELVGDIGNGLKALANGDLHYVMDDGYQGKYRELAEDFAATNQQLTNVVGSILGASQEMRSSTQEMSTAADDLSSRTQSQASNIQETAASLEEISKTVQINTDNAKEANDNATNAVMVVQNGRDTVDAVVEIINELKASSTKISEITGLIEEIAFQTNLLALNASVEAARAGDAGKGFSVVADEVRQLAHRTTKASKEIKELINTSTDQVDTGVVRAEEASEMLVRINETVEGAAKLMSEVAMASGEQAIGVSEINTSVSKLDEITQQNAAMVEETSATATAIAQLAADTDEIVSFFDLEERQQQKRLR